MLGRSLRRFVCTDIALASEDATILPTLSRQARDNIQALAELGVPVRDGFDIFNASRPWRRLSRDMAWTRDPVLILISGLYLMNSSEDQGQGQYDIFATEASKYDSGREDHFFRVAMDALTSQFPNSLVVFMQHTQNVRWPCVDERTAASAFLRIQVQDKAGGQRLVNWRYDDEGRSANFPGVYQAICLGAGLGRVGNFVHALPGQNLLQIWDLVVAALQAGPVLNMACNLFTNQLALARYVMQSTLPHALPRLPSDATSPLPRRRLAFGGTETELTYTRMMQLYSEETPPAKLACWWYNYNLSRGVNASWDSDSD